MKPAAAVVTLGVDLNDPEVLRLLRRLLYGRFAGALRDAEIDPEDVLQKVHLSLLVRNRGRNPYDPRRSEMPGYLFAVVQGVTLNALDHRRRAADRGWNLATNGDAATLPQAATLSLW